MGNNNKNLKKKKKRKKPLESRERCHINATDITMYSHSCDNKVLPRNIWYTLTHMANTYSYTTKSCRNRWEWICVCCLTNGISFSWQLLKALDNIVQSLALLYTESVSCFLWLYLYNSIFIKLNCLSTSDFTSHFHIAAKNFLDQYQGITCKVKRQVPHQLSIMLQQVCILRVKKLWRAKEQITKAGFLLLTSINRDWQDVVHPLIFRYGQNKGS